MDVKPVEEVLKKYQQEYSDEDDRPSVGLTELSEAVSSPELAGVGPAEPEDGGVEAAAETEAETEEESLPIIEDDGELEGIEAETSGPNGEAPREVETAAPPVKPAAPVSAAPSAGTLPLNIGVGHAVSTRALQLVYNAREHKVALKYPAYGLTDYAGERCLAIYIPNPAEGVMGLLPESKAGLRRGERLEDLLRDPFVRVLPERINRQEGYCTLNRALAQEIESRRAWVRLTEGADVDALVVGVQRSAKRVILDVDGLLAVMPISEISHSYVEDINFRRGEIVPVRVLKKRESATESNGKREVRRRLVVSKKAREFNPWLYENLIPVLGRFYRGVITYIGVHYFHVKLESGIDVLVKQPSPNYKKWSDLVVGNEVVVYVTYLDRESRRVYGTFNPRNVNADIELYARRPPGRPARVN